jgi:hypothetical protein
MGGANGATASTTATATGATETGVTVADAATEPAILKTKRLAGNGTEAAAKVVCAPVLPVKLCVHVRACACVCVRVRACACVFVYL